MRIKIFFVILLPFFLLFTGQTAAQDTTLHFNRVILYDLGFTSPTNSQAITVPAGKIWKIESVSMGSSGSSSAIFLKNSSSQNIAFFTSPASNASANYPFWLPDGFTGSLMNNNPSYRCTVSITEYTKTP